MLYTDAINLPLVCLPQRLVQPSCDRPFDDYSYLSHCLFWTISFFCPVIIIGSFFSPWLRQIVFFNKLLKLSSLDQLLNLLLQITTLISVVTVIFVEATILLLVSFLRR